MSAALAKPSSSILAPGLRLTLTVGLVFLIVLLAPPPRVGAQVPACGEHAHFDPNETPVAPVGPGQVFYVDGTQGSDSNDGLSEAQAFRTIGKALDRYGPLAAGDTVRIKSGLYRTRPTITRSGTASARIMIGAYGDGPVVIDASTAVTGWTLVSGQIYRAPVSFGVTAVVVDDVALFPEFSQGALQEGRYYYDSGAQRLYVWVPGGGNPASRDVGVVVDDKYEDGFAVNNAHHVTLYGLTVRFAGGHGISVLGDDVRIEKCRARFNGKAGINFFGYDSTESTGAQVIKNEVYFNVLTNWPRGRYKWGGWAMGVVSNGTPDVLYEGNVVYRNGGEGLGAYSGSGATIRDNVAYDNWSVNIYVDNRPNVVVENNYVYSNTPDPTDLYNNGDTNPGDNKNLKRLRPEGIHTADESYGLNPPANLENVTIANNVIVNCRRGIGHWGQASGSGLKNVRVLHNTIVTGIRMAGEDALVGIEIPHNDGNNTGSIYRNNIVYGSDPGTWLLSAADIPASANQFQGLTIDHNLFFHTGRSDAFHWGESWSGSYDYTHAEWLALSGSAHGAGDRWADPQLVSVGTIGDAQAMQPREGSPVLGAGTPTAATHDYQFCSRSGSAPTVGAFESTDAGPVIPAPTITTFSPTSGGFGVSVAITGTSFTGATEVAFNAVSASYSVDSETSITATVPPGATTGPISVTTPAGTAASATDFVVIPPSNHTLTVVPTGIGGGGVASSPTGIACGVDCTQTYPWGTVVSLQATPAPGSTVVGWSGGCTGAGPTCDVTMDGAKTVTVYFDLLPEAITWERFIATEASGATLRRPAGGGWNAGAVSNRVLVAGPGYVEYTLPASPGFAMFGLSHGDTDGGYADIDYALYTYPANGHLMVYEKGVSRGMVGTYAQGDLLRVSVEGGMVTYRQNGSLLGTSVVAPTYPLLADTSLYSAGAEMLDGRIAGQLADRVVLPAAEVLWRNLVRTTASGSSLTRESSWGWNGGASSAQELVSGDGFAEYRVTGPGDYVVFGLSRGDTDAGYADIDHAIYTYPSTGELFVFESGVFEANLGGYGVDDILRVGVEDGVVTYSVNGAVLFSSSVAPVYPLVADTSLYSAGAKVAETRMGGDLREIVSWTHFNGVEAVGDTLTRPTPGGWTAGAISSRRIPTGTGGAEHTVADMSSYVMFGLSHGDSDGSYADIDYALYTYPPTGAVIVYESGTSRGQYGTYAPGDVLRVSVDDGVVSYWKGDSLLYTSSTPATYPLVLDVSLYTGVIQGAGLHGNLASPPVIEEDVVWTNLVNVTDAGGPLERPTGSGWDAGAVSSQGLMGDGYVEYTVSNLADYVMFGLGTGDADQGFGDVECALYTYPPEGRLYVFEDGTYRATGGGYAVGDTLRVSVEGGVVKYRKNGTLLYSSVAAPTYPLNLDTSLYSTGATVAGARIGWEE